MVKLKGPRQNSARVPQGTSRRHLHRVGGRWKSKEFNVDEWNRK